MPNRGFPFETHSFMIRGRERRSKWYPFVPWIRPLHRRISTARNYRPADLRRLLEGAGFSEVGTTCKPIALRDAPTLRHANVLR